MMKMRKMRKGVTCFGGAMRLPGDFRSTSLDDACLRDLYPLLVLFSVARSILITVVDVSEDGEWEIETGEWEIETGKWGMALSTSHRAPTYLIWTRKCQ
jgi:hypothetical protein